MSPLAHQDDSVVRVGVAFPGSHETVATAKVNSLCPAHDGEACVLEAFGVGAMMTLEDVANFRENVL